VYQCKECIYRRRNVREYWWCGVTSMKRKISGYYGYWCHVKKKRIFKTLYEKVKWLKQL
jgi:hypothetical protein